MESIASIGTGLAEREAATSHGNALEWAKKLISFAVESERLWREGILEDPEMQEVPKVRVNPPRLGSLDAFTSESIPKLQKGMDDYFASAGGEQTMGELVDMVHAKLWQVHNLPNLVAGYAEKELLIEMRDTRLDLTRKSIDELREIIKKREVESGVGPTDGASSPNAGADELHGLDKNELVARAEEAIKLKPFVPPFEGNFVVRFDCEERVLAPGQRNFALQRATASTDTTVELNVLWRSCHSEVSICGFPRRVRVLANTHQ